MTTSTSRRSSWVELPDELRGSIERRLGAPVLSSVDQTGGFTHGVASRLRLADGTRVFIKVMPVNDELAADYRAEARCAARLPRVVPASRLRWSTEDDRQIVLVFDDVEGRNPDIRVHDDLRLVLAAVTSLAELLTPNPVPDAPPSRPVLAPLMHGWRTFAADGPPANLDPWSLRNLDRIAELEPGWVQATDGNTLLHADLRPDNMVRTPGGELVIVDWACACVGAAWMDLLILLGSVDGVDHEAIVTSNPVTRRVDRVAVDAFICALAGLWAEQSRLPPVPRSPHLRAFQARNADVTRAWLSQRTGWR